MEMGLLKDALLNRMRCREVINVVDCIAEAGQQAFTADNNSKFDIVRQSDSSCASDALLRTYLLIASSG